MNDQNEMQDYKTVITSEARWFDLKLDELWEYRDLVLLFVKRNFTSRYKQTIRQLCDRCIVLEHGRIVFDGDTEEAIRVYMGSDAGKAMQDIRTEDDMRPRNFRRPPCEITSIHFEKENTLDFGDQLVYTLENIFTIRQSDKFKGEIGWNARWWGHTSVALESKNAVRMS